MPLMSDYEKVAQPYTIIKGGKQMAKLRKGELVLSLEEGQMLKGYDFVHVGINVYTFGIVLTPTNDGEPIEVEDDPILGNHEEKPHTIKVTDEGYVIDVKNLTDYIPATDEYTTVKGKSTLGGIVMPPHLVLVLPTPEDESKFEDDYEAPKNMEELEEQLNDLSLDELREVAEYLGIGLIQSDWRKTIISKIKTYWKKEWKNAAQ